jgi:hypothetical protein
MFRKAAFSIKLRRKRNIAGTLERRIGPTDLAVTKVILAVSQLKKMLALGTEFNGEMNGNEIVGA